MMTRCALTRLAVLTLAALFALPALARPDRDRDGVEVEIADLSRGDVRRMGDPVLTDRTALRARVDALAADINALGRLVEVIDNRRQRKVLAEQVAAMNERLALLRAEIKMAAPARLERRRRHRRDGSRDGSRGGSWDDSRGEPPVDAPPPVAATPEPAEPVDMGPEAITSAELAALKKSIKDATFRKDQLQVLKLAAQGQHYTTAQAREIVKGFSFDSDKVEVLATLHPRLVDPENFHTLLSSITHASNRRKLMKRVGAPAPR